MFIPYFFEPHIKQEQEIITLSDINRKHISLVLRMKTDNKIILTDGKGYRYFSRISHITKKEVIVIIEEREYVPNTQPHIHIAMGIPKQLARFEWFIEKSTELGIQSIIPMISKRTEKVNIAQQRMQHIIISAIQQSQQTWIPHLYKPTSFQEVLLLYPQAQKYIGHCEAKIKTPIHSIELSREYIFLIGPEGDFTPQEIDIALQQGYKGVSLGTHRLRTETAGIAIALWLRMNNL